METRLYDVVRPLFICSLCDPCYYCPQSFFAFLLNTGGQQIRSQSMKHVHILYSNCKLEHPCILTGTLHFLVINNTPFVASSLVITIIRTDWAIC